MFVCAETGTIVSDDVYYLDDIPEDLSDSEICEYAKEHGEKVDIQLQRTAKAIKGLVNDLL